MEREGLYEWRSRRKAGSRKKDKEIYTGKLHVSEQKGRADIAKEEAAAWAGQMEFRNSNPLNEQEALSVNEQKAQRQERIKRYKNLLGISKADWDK